MEGFAVVLGLLIPIGLGLIPANIASKKGRSFGLWWLYGWALFIVALIHSICLEDYTSATPRYQPVYQPVYQPPAAPAASAASTADELKKYKDLLDQGAITQEEFDAQKRRLLK